MKYLILLSVLASFNLYAEDREGDLLQPVTDLSTIQKQEEEVPPTIDEVEMKQPEKKPTEVRKKSK